MLVMIYYTPPINEAIVAAIEQGLLGSFDSPSSRSRPLRSASFCVDNGCFSDNYVGDRGYLDWLTNIPEDDTPRCAFATAPDVVCEAAETLERSAPMFAPIRKLGFPVALVAQNGLEDLTVPWDDFDVLFIGGDTEWKLGPAAASLVTEAQLRGRGTHMGRVNGLRRLRYAKSIGCDSVDGSHLAYGSDKNLPQLLAWMEDVNGAGGVVCVMCGERFRPVRLDARTCGDRCRKRLERVTRRNAEASLEGR